MNLSPIPPQQNVVHNYYVKFKSVIPRHYGNWEPLQGMTCYSFRPIWNNGWVMLKNSEFEDSISFLIPVDSIEYIERINNPEGLW